MSLVIDSLLAFANVSAISFCTIMKLPQVYSLLKTKSPFGVSLYGLLLELTAYSIMLSYNIYSDYPLVSYLEYPFLVVQDVAMLVIVLFLSKMTSPLLFIPAAAFSFLMVAISWGLLPKFFIRVLVSFCTIFSSSSKLIQLMSIISRKDSTGVSATTWIISAYTCIARLFTIYIQTMDVSLLINFGVNLILSSSVACSTFIYKPKMKAAGKKQKSKKKKKQN